MTEYKLTERERSVLHGFAQGLEADAVAENLGITTEQVEQISLNILNKLFAGAVYQVAADTPTPTDAFYEEELVGV